MHDIEIGILEASSAGRRVRALDIGDIVDASEGGQRFIPEALRADRQSIDASLPVPQRITTVQRSGVRFHRDLDVGRQTEAPGDPVEQRGYFGRRKQARRTPAEKHAHQLAPCNALRLGAHIRQQCIDIAAARRIAARRMGVEVTVWALSHAPGQMDVQREWRYLQHAGASETRQPCRQLS